MVLRDRNHPSIVIWSLCNELGCVADDPLGHFRAAAFKLAICSLFACAPAAAPGAPAARDLTLSGRHAHRTPSPLLASPADEADTTRPITGNTVQTPYLEHRFVDPFSQVMDVQSFSYEPDVLLPYHAAAPWKATGNGEAGSCVTDRGYYGPANGSSGHLGPTADAGLFVCARDGWGLSATLPFSYGSFLWTGFDYCQWRPVA